MSALIPHHDASMLVKTHNGGVIRVRASGTLVHLVSVHSHTSFSLPPERDFLLLSRPRKKPVYVVLGDQSGGDEEEEGPGYGWDGGIEAEDAANR